MGRVEQSSKRAHAEKGTNDSTTDNISTDNYYFRLHHRLLFLYFHVFLLDMKNEYSYVIFIRPKNVDEDILRLGSGSWAVELDLMQPLDPARAPKVHVPTLNHIGIWVDPLDAAVKYLEEQGVRFTPGGIRKGASGHEVCFIHPKGSDAMPRGGEGVLIELVQAPPEVIALAAGDKTSGPAS